MRPIVLLFLVSLLHSYDFQGAVALTRLFVQKGTDLLLEVTAPVYRDDESEFKWKFNQDFIVRLLYTNKTRITPNFQGRVELFPHNYSLLLKNVTRADSGHYCAVVAGDDEESVGEYNVTVQDLVSPVEGKVTFVSFSPASCNVTVTCSTQDSYFINDTFRCDANTCSQDGDGGGGGRSKVTTFGASLGVYLYNNYSVICSHTNQISSANDTIMIMQHCSGPSPSITLSIPFIIIITIAAVVVVVIVVIATRFGLKKKRKSEGSMDFKNTVYETVQVKTVAGFVDQTSPDEAAHEATTYCLVGAGTMTLPESHDAQVNRSARSEQSP